MARMVILVILDGWGIGDRNESNPVHVVQPQTFKWLEENYPVTSLQASGIAIGLPWGATGNSEVGHLTIGAGKVIYQYYPRIDLAIRDGSFFENPVFKKAFEHARQNKSAVNLVGILTEGTVHAALEHLLALIDMGEKENVPVWLHLFGDGKDASPYRLQSLLEKIPQEKLATLMGRYYGMDREGNWQLTERAYETLTGQGGIIVSDPLPIIQNTYDKGFNEEFVPPMRFGEDKGIKDNEAVIFFNFREDSIRQIAQSFIENGFNKFPTKKFKNLYIATMSHYKESFDVPVAYPPDKVLEPLGKVISDAGKTQLRLAESYKYAHVTYFFNSYIEAPLKNEYRVFIPSIKMPHVDDRPEMMASGISDRIIQAIENQSFDFILVNYANGDTIAHTGNYQAALAAVKTIDNEIGRVLRAAEGTDAVIIITSDHGNIEEMVNPITGEPESQHDPNPVPFYLVGRKYKGKKFFNWQNLKTETAGVLSDVAPTVLALMGIPAPEAMTGKNLVKDLI